MFHGLRKSIIDLCVSLKVITWKCSFNTLSLEFLSNSHISSTTAVILQHYGLVVLKHEWQIMKMSSQLKCTRLSCRWKQQRPDQCVTSTSQPGQITVSQKPQSSSSASDIWSESTWTNTPNTLLLWFTAGLTGQTQTHFILN